MPTQEELETKEVAKEKPQVVKPPTPVVSSDSEPDLFKEESDYLSDDVYKSDDSVDSIKTYENYKLKALREPRKRKKKKKKRGKTIRYISSSSDSSDDEEIIIRRRRPKKNVIYYDDIKAFVDSRRKEKNEPEVVEPPKQDVQKATRQEEFEKRY